MLNKVLGVTMTLQTGAFAYLLMTEKPPPAPEPQEVTVKVVKEVVAPTPAPSR